ncbi:hypothetical protein T07_2822 [Trichinella nelsoni]|uniref:Uncharacterized protein n=1 Tax=Trichinella nelsoni TaxID=6336 RepID=A0A0V0RBG6_9BILA|nr:hypothetical protein T07_2822 [Trichinella nelsoni]
MLSTERTEKSVEVLAADEEKMLYNANMSQYQAE